MTARKYPLTTLLATIGLLVAAFAFTTSASAYPAGQSASLSANASRVSPGGSVTVTGSHFNGLVTFKVGSDVVGTVTANADGTFSANVSLSSADYPPGTYTISATDAFGDEQTITVTVTAAAVVTKPGSGDGGLPNTGIALLSIGGLGVLLLLGGGVMLLTGRRRKVAV